MKPAALPTASIPPRKVGSARAVPYALSSTQLAAHRAAQRKVDPLIFDPEVARRGAKLLMPLLRRYFRAEVRGLENIPKDQTLLVSHHDGGMLPLDGPLLVGSWHERFHFQRPLYVLVHDMVMTVAGPGRDTMRRCGCLLADRHNLDAALDAGADVMVYPGGSRETFRSFWERKTISLGFRTGFVKHALRRRLLLTPVVSAGVHETFIVLLRGSWLADKLGITRRFRADVFPLVAGLPFGLWPGVAFPHFPLPAKITVQVLPPIDLHKEFTERLMRPLREDDLHDDILLRRGFERVRVTMQRALDKLYAERRFPVIG